MITSEEVKVSVEEIESIEDVKSCLEIYSNAKLWENIKQYIAQQEKVSELLELYRILFSLNDNFDDEDIYKIKNDIKLLEDELNDNK